MCGCRYIRVEFVFSFSIVPQLIPRLGTLEYRAAYLPTNFDLKWEGAPTGAPSNKSAVKFVASLVRWCLPRRARAPRQAVPGLAVRTAAKQVPAKAKRAGVLLVRVAAL